MRVAFFDIDRTVLRGNSQSALAAYLFLKGFYSFKSVFFFVLWALGNLLNVSIISNRRVREVCYSVFSGKPTSDIDSLLAEFCEKHISSQISIQAAREIEALKKEDVKIVFISATLQPIGEAVSRLLEGDYCFCTRLKNENGYDGTILGDVVEGVVKRNIAINFSTCNNIDLKSSFAYGDSMSDIDMLELVGYPIVVNPDKKLRKQAVQRKWRIESWL